MRKIRGDGNQLKDVSGYSAAGKLPENQKYGPRRLDPSRHGDNSRETRTWRNRQSASLERYSRDPAPLPGFGAGIRRRMGDLRVENKTGALDALRSDVGIVYSPGGRIAMAITVDGIPKPDWTPDNPGLLMIADLAKILVDGLGKR